MIRALIVIGILNSEKLQLDPDPKLETAVTKVCQSEAVKQQQSTVRGRDSETTIEDVHVSSSKPKHQEKHQGPHGNCIKGFRQRDPRVANLNLAAAQDVVNHRIISNLI